MSRPTSLTENFVRAVNGDPSLQQAGGKIDGAEAESDKDLPPGKYARFVDGANACRRWIADTVTSRGVFDPSVRTITLPRSSQIFAISKW
jgi:hypothetical protein